MLTLLLACQSTDPCGPGTVEEDGVCVPADTDADTDTDTDTDTDADTDTDSDTDADTDTDADSDADPLPDARAAMTTDGTVCDGMGGGSVRGGKVWYWGEVAAGGTGQEAWYVYVNTNWAAAGGADCVVLWEIEWADTGVGACAACDLGVSVTAASINVEGTTCGADAYTFYDPTDEAYAVDIAADGVSTWYFSASGTAFAEGYGEGEAANYLADGGCDVAWF